MTNEAKLRAQDKRLQKKYGITLADRNERIRQQDNKCKICDGPLDAYGHPNVDHFHFRVKAFRHTSVLLDGAKWYAQAYNERGQVVCVMHAKTKAKALADVKKMMMPWAVRGMLCFKCNKGLGYIERFFDAAAHPENLLPVIEYLRARLKPLDNTPIL